MQRVLVLELNELCPPLLDRFIAAGELPAFRALRESSSVFVTEAEEPQDHLNPWIQWVTAHTGVGFDEHRVFKLGEGAALRHATVADAVSAAGGTVWLCGPMNVVPTAPVRGRWLPDPWNPDDTVVDPELAGFAGFVRANVQEHTNAAHRMSLGDHVRFLGFMVRHGLRPATLGATIRQVVGERTKGGSRWRRAALLDRFQWDLFRWVYRRDQPTFATYFSNTTAHYQHTYWRYMEPDAFTLKPEPADVERLGGAILFGYQEMDRIVAEAMALVASTDTALVLCTALSQQPYTLRDDEGGSQFHRPYDIAALVDELGIGGVAKVAPVMAAQFHLYFGAEAAAVAAHDALRDATLAGDAAFDVRRVGTDVFCGCRWTKEVPPGSVLHVPATGASVAFHDRFYRAETAKSGYHHPQGALWVRTPDGVGGEAPDPVPLRAVAPTLLRLLGLTAPETMQTEPLSLVAPV